MAGWMGSRSSDMIWTVGIYNALKKVDKEISKTKKERSTSLTPSASRCSSTPVSTYEDPFTTVERVETTFSEREEAERQLNENSQKIYDLLKNTNKFMTVEKIIEQVKLPKTVVTGNLMLLYKKGLIERTKVLYDEETEKYQRIKVWAFSAYWL